MGMISPQPTLLNESMELAEIDFKSPVQVYQFLLKVRKSFVVLDKFEGRKDSDEQEVEGFITTIF